MASAPALGILISKQTLSLEGEERQQLVELSSI